MKFRYDDKSNKIIKYVIIGILVLSAILFIIYLSTHNSAWLYFFISALMVAVIFYLLMSDAKNIYIDFQGDTIFISHGRMGSVKIIITDIETILIPSATALKNKKEINHIIFKRKNIADTFDGFLSTTRYSIEIENYIKENLTINIKYYDDYNKVSDY